jgi:hypothetical protein
MLHDDYQDLKFEQLCDKIMNLVHKFNRLSKAGKTSEAVPVLSQAILAIRDGFVHKPDCVWLPVQLASLAEKVLNLTPA